MLKRILLLVAFVLAASTLVFSQRSRGVLLEDLTWVEAERVLTPEAVVVIPIGAQAKEHGPHLKLKNDWLIAEYLKKRVLGESKVVVAPTVNYSFYPAFVEYPGSTSLSLETARDMIVQLCRGLARFGPRKFYGLNTGVSTIRALKPAAEILAKEGIEFRFTELSKVLSEVEKQVSKQEGGTHADEIETSMMLYIAPRTVKMKLAVKDYKPGRGPLTRDPKNPNGVYSPTGIWGDPTLATRAKGKMVMEAFVRGVLGEIEELRSSALVPR